MMLRSFLSCVVVAVAATMASAASVLSITPDTEPGMIITIPPGDYADIIIGHTTKGQRVVASSANGNITCTGVRFTGTFTGAHLEFTGLTVNGMMTQSRPMDGGSLTFRNNTVSDGISVSGVMKNLTVIDLSDNTVTGGGMYIGRVDGRSDLTPDTAASPYSAAVFAAVGATTPDEKLTVMLDRLTKITIAGSTVSHDVGTSNAYGIKFAGELWNVGYVNTSDVRCRAIGAAKAECISFADIEKPSGLVAPFMVTSIIAHGMNLVAESDTNACAFCNSGNAEVFSMSVKDSTFRAVTKTGATAKALSFGLMEDVGVGTSPGGIVVKNVTATASSDTTNAYAAGISGVRTLSAANLALVSSKAAGVATANTTQTSTDAADAWESLSALAFVDVTASATAATSRAYALAVTSGVTGPGSEVTPRVGAHVLFHNVTATGNSDGSAAYVLYLEAIADVGSFSLTQCTLTATAKTTGARAFRVPEMRGISGNITIADVVATATVTAGGDAVAVDSAGARDVGGSVVVTRVTATASATLTAASSGATTGVFGQMMSIGGHVVFADSSFVSTVTSPPAIIGSSWYAFRLAGFRHVGGAVYARNITASVSGGRSMAAWTVTSACENITGGVFISDATAVADAKPNGAQVFTFPVMKQVRGPIVFDNLDGRAIGTESTMAFMVDAFDDVDSVSIMNAHVSAISTAGDTASALRLRYPRFISHGIYVENCNATAYARDHAEVFTFTSSPDFVGDGQTVPREERTAIFSPTTTASITAAADVRTALSVVTDVAPSDIDNAGSSAASISLPGAVHVNTPLTFTAAQNFVPFPQRRGGFVFRNATMTATATNGPEARVFWTNRGVYRVGDILLIDSNLKATADTEGGQAFVFTTTFRDMQSIVIANTTVAAFGGKHPAAVSFTTMHNITGVEIERGSVIEATTTTAAVASAAYFVVNSARGGMNVSHSTIRAKCLGSEGSGVNIRGARAFYLLSMVSLEGGGIHIAHSHFEVDSGSGKDASAASVYGKTTDVVAFVMTDSTCRARTTGDTGAACGVLGIYSHATTDALGLRHFVISRSHFEVNNGRAAGIGGSDSFGLVSVLFDSVTAKMTSTAGRWDRTEFAFTNSLFGDDTNPRGQQTLIEPVVLGSADDENKKYTEAFPTVVDGVMAWSPTVHLRSDAAVRTALSTAAPTADAKTLNYGTPSTARGVTVRNITVKPGDFDVAGLGYVVRLGNMVNLSVMIHDVDITASIGSGDCLSMPSAVEADSVTVQDVKVRLTAAETGATNLLSSFSVKHMNSARFQRLDLDFQSAQGYAYLWNQAYFENIKTSFAIENITVNAKVASATTGIASVLAFRTFINVQGVVMRNITGTGEGHTAVVLEWTAFEDGGSLLLEDVAVSVVAKSGTSISNGARGVKLPNIVGPQTEVSVRRITCAARNSNGAVQCVDIGGNNITSVAMEDVDVTLTGHTRMATMSNTFRHLASASFSRMTFATDCLNTRVDYLRVMVPLVADVGSVTCRDIDLTFKDVDKTRDKHFMNLASPGFVGQAVIENIKVVFPNTVSNTGDAGTVTALYLVQPITDARLEDFTEIDAASRARIWPHAATRTSSVLIRNISASIVLPRSQIAVVLDLCPRNTDRFTASNISVDITAGSGVRVMSCHNTGGVVEGNEHFLLENLTVSAVSFDRSMSDVITFHTGIRHNYGVFTFRNLDITATAIVNAGTDRRVNILQFPSFTNNTGVLIDGLKITAKSKYMTHALMFPNGATESPLGINITNAVVDLDADISGSSPGQGCRFLTLTTVRNVGYLQLLQSNVKLNSDAEGGDVLALTATVENVTRIAVEDSTIAVKAGSEAFVISVVNKVTGVDAFEVLRSDVTLETSRTSEKTHVLTFEKNVEDCGRFYFANSSFVSKATGGGSTTTSRCLSFMTHLQDSDSLSIVNSNFEGSAIGSQTQIAHVINLQILRNVDTVFISGVRGKLKQDSTSGYSSILSAGLTGCKSVTFQAIDLDADSKAGSVRAFYLQQAYDIGQFWIDGAAVRVHSDESHADAVTFNEFRYVRQVMIGGVRAAATATKAKAKAFAINGFPYCGCVAIHNSTASARVLVKGTATTEGITAHAFVFQGAVIVDSFNMTNVSAVAKAPRGTGTGVGSTRAGYFSHTFQNVRQVKFDGFSFQAVGEDTNDAKHMYALTLGGFSNSTSVEFLNGVVDTWAASSSSAMSFGSISQVGAFFVTNVTATCRTEHAHGPNDVFSFSSLLNVGDVVISHSRARVLGHGGSYALQLSSPNNVGRIIIADSEIEALAQSGLDNCAVLSTSRFNNVRGLFILRSNLTAHFDFLGGARKNAEVFRLTTSSKHFGDIVIQDSRLIAEAPIHAAVFSPELLIMPHLGSFSVVRSYIYARATTSRAQALWISPHHGRRFEVINSTIRATSANLAVALESIYGLHNFTEGIVITGSTIEATTTGAGASALRLATIIDVPSVVISNNIVIAKSQGRTANTAMFQPHWSNTQAQVGAWALFFSSGFRNIPGGIHIVNNSITAETAGHDAFALGTGSLSAIEEVDGFVVSKCTVSAKAGHNAQVLAFDATGIIKNLTAISV